MDKNDVRISVVTVTYNAEGTLAKTIRSVLAQTHAAYEYIIVDGASSDKTVEVAESFRSDIEAKGIAYTVISEKDDGIYDAMNKGAKAAAGDIVGIINSGDTYEEIALETVADAYVKEPFDLFYADIRMVLSDGKSFIKHAKDRRYATSRDWNHPTTFIKKSVYEKYSYRTDNIHDDYDLILRLKKDGAKTVVVNKVLASFPMDGVSHRRSFAAARDSIRIKYDIYRRNGYSRFYMFECVLVELGKLIIG